MIEQVKLFVNEKVLKLVKKIINKLKIKPKTVRRQHRS